MTTNMGIQFWKRQLIKKYRLNEIGKDLLNLLIYHNPDKVQEYILDIFSRCYREEIIEMYCDNYNEKQINLILEDIGEYKLEKIEIEEFGIKTKDEDLENEKI